MADCTCWTRTVTLMAGEKTIATAQSTCQCEDDPPLETEPMIGQATFSGWTDTYETCEKPAVNKVVASGQKEEGLMENIGVVMDVLTLFALPASLVGRGMNIIFPLLDELAKGE